ncbi:DUF4974 domain-containing protein [Pseudoflavitalea sp. X16]|uniref:FecR family protein n=1 Tax=Paraflavitalea devenefica TaxID=2716334 RepID=UPI0014224F7F|nr:FecR family protein [Paraflavitalea devenefica]NII26070.1 DUF4974 domain-containing protein [Paraflavitalea devenefica]
MNKLEHLLEGYLSDNLSEAELKELLALLDREETHLPELIQHLLEQQTVAGLGNVELRDRLFSQVMQRVKEQKATQAPVKRMHLLRWATAAAVVIIISGLIFFLRLPKQEGATVQQSTGTGNDVLPGTQGAILTLANGSSLVLDTLRHGMIAQEPGARVSLKDGQLAYHPESATAVGYNTITTPRGRQFSLMLPDGSMVWLNAASSLRYPTAFTGNERVVELTGEAYFEIAKDPSMPFQVTVKNMEVEVLGTHFNINAYDDEDAIRTTLLEGKVKVTPVVGSQLAAHSSKLLALGQQAQIINNKLSIINNVDIAAVMAWKNGLFRFDHADLHTVMRQLARWYDVEVVFEKGAPVQEVFQGEMQRTLKLSQVLKILENMQVHFRIEAGKRVIVTP